MIAIVSCSHSPDDERVYHKQMRSLEKKGHRIFYITHSELETNLSSNLIYHINFKKTPNLKKYIDFVINKIKAQDKVTHVQIHETELLPIFKVIKSRSKNIVTIYDVHENMEALYRTFSVRAWPIKEIAIKIRKLKEKIYLKYVDQIILANIPIGEIPYVRDSIPTAVLQNFPEKKHCGFSRESERKKPRFIYHGHLAPERGIDDLIKAMFEVVHYYPQATLTLIGTFRTTVFRDEIQKLIHDNSFENVVKIFNQIPHNEIWGVLKDHTIGVIPFARNPLTEENTPTKLFEMMASGLEIVSTDLPPIRHFVNESVYWASPEDPGSLREAMISAIKSLRQSSSIKKNLDLIEKKYNWGVIEKRYLDLFEVR